MILICVVSAQSYLLNHKISDFTRHICQQSKSKNITLNVLKSQRIFISSSFIWKHLLEWYHFYILQLTLYIPVSTAESDSKYLIHVIMLWSRPGDRISHQSALFMYQTLVSAPLSSVWHQLRAGAEWVSDQDWLRYQRRKRGAGEHSRTILRLVLVADVYMLNKQSYKYSLDINK